MKQYKRRHMNKYLFLRTVLVLFIIAGIPTLFIYWAVSASYRALRGGPVHTSVNSESTEASELQQYDWKPFAKKMEERNRLLQNSCQTLGVEDQMNSNDESKFWSIFHINGGSIIACDVLGVTEALMCHTRDTDICSAEVHRRAGLYELRSVDYPLATTFLIVQHPFERIINIFKNLHSEEKQKIIEKMNNEENSYVAGAEITFEMFVGYILEVVKENQLNENWSPIYKACIACLMDFQDIIHMENIKEEQKYILYKARLEISSPEELSEMILDKSETTYYFSQLSHNMILDLYKVYRYDFKSFGYSLGTYIEVGIPEPTSTISSMLN